MRIAIAGDNPGANRQERYFSTGTTHSGYEKRDGPYRYGEAKRGRTVLLGDHDSGEGLGGVKPAQQTQNVATLNTDVAHAANALSPIFDKEKEHQRLQQVQQIADIGNQVMDVIRTQGAIEAANARKDPVALEAARQALIKGGNNEPTADQIAAKAGNTAMQQYGTGSSLQRAAQAVTAAVQGLAGGNLQAAISGAAAPYLANTIKQLVGDNDEARIMAQAVLGAVVAKAQGNSPAAGAAGAAVGELIAAALYPDTKPQDLPEDKRQLVVLLSTLAAGLAGGLVGGTAADGLAGAQAGQTAVENNHLSQTDRIALDQKKKTYTADCSGAAAASTGCQALYKDIGELEDKGRSILQLEQIVVGSDMGQDVTQAHPPGEVVPCAGSGNGYCVVSNTAVQTQDGLEWALTPANDVQAQAALTKNQQDGARLDNDSRINGEQLPAAGCAGPGVVSALCQGYFTLGGENPFTGQAASTSDRVGYGLDLALQVLPFLALGLSAAKATGAAEVPATSAIARVGLKDDLAAQAGIPRNIAESPSSMWGKSIDEIKQSLTLDGASLTPKAPLAGTSGKAQVFIVEGHPAIKEVEFHPGGGTHGDSPYYRLVSTEKIGNKNIEIRVIDPSPDFSPGTITRYQQYYDTQGNRLKYEGGEWKGWK